MNIKTTCRILALKAYIKAYKEKITEFEGKVQAYEKELAELSETHRKG